jgi:hypothetical protein
MSINKIVDDENSLRNIPKPTTPEEHRVAYKRIMAANIPYETRLDILTSYCALRSFTPEENMQTNIELSKGVAEFNREQTRRDIETVRDKNYRTFVLNK